MTVDRPLSCSSESSLRGSKKALFSVHWEEYTNKYVRLADCYVCCSSRGCRYRVHHDNCLCVCVSFHSLGMMGLFLEMLWLEESHGQLNRSIFWSETNFASIRGCPDLARTDMSIPDLLLKHPRIFEYKVEAGQSYLTKGKARIQVNKCPKSGMW
jgi:hypothetical protein